MLNRCFKKKIHPSQTPFHVEPKGIFLLFSEATQLCIIQKFDTVNAIKSNIISAHYFLNYFHKGLHLFTNSTQNMYKVHSSVHFASKHIRTIFVVFQAKLTLLDYSKDKPTESILCFESLLFFWVSLIFFSAAKVCKGM